MPAILAAHLGPLPRWAWAAIGAGALFVVRARARASGNGGEDAPEPGRGYAMTGRARATLGNVFAENGDLVPADPHDLPPSTVTSQPPIVYDPAPAAAAGGGGTTSSSSSRPASSSGEVQSSSFSPRTPASSDYRPNSGAVTVGGMAAQLPPAPSGFLKTFAAALTPSSSGGSVKAV